VRAATSAPKHGTGLIHAQQRLVDHRHALSADFQRRGAGADGFIRHELGAVKMMPGSRLADEIALQHLKGKRRQSHGIIQRACQLPIGHQAQGLPEKLFLCHKLAQDSHILHKVATPAPQQEDRK
jgi:hypothetical protein